MTPEVFKQKSKKGVDDILPAVIKAMELLTEQEAFNHITNSIQLSSILCNNSEIIMAGVQAEALMRLAKLTHPSLSSPSTTLAE